MINSNSTSLLNSIINKNYMEMMIAKSKLLLEKLFYTINKSY